LSLKNEREKLVESAITQPLIVGFGRNLNTGMSVCYGFGQGEEQIILKF